jgi:putative redox protein
MPTEYTVRAVHRGGMRIDGHAAGQSVAMDYPLAAGDQCAGFTPLQLLLVSLAGCSGNSLAVLLRKLKQPVAGIEVEVKAVRREEHPTVFTQISLEFVVRGQGLDEGAVSKALEQSEETVCPVWAMLKGATPIRATYRIEPSA